MKAKFAAGVRCGRSEHSPKPIRVAHKLVECYLDSGQPEIVSRFANYPMNLDYRVTLRMHRSRGESDQECQSTKNHFELILTRKTIAGASVRFQRLSRLNRRTLTYDGHREITA